MKRVVFIALVLAVVWMGIGYAGEVMIPKGWPTLEEVQKAIEEKGANWEAGMPDEKQMMYVVQLFERNAHYDDDRDLILQEFQEEGSLYPSSFDWRNKDGHNWMTSVKSQEGCGSCYAFSAAGALEAHWRIKHGKWNIPIDLSEQVMVSCGSGAGCDGWTLESAVAFLKNEGLPAEDCYEYIADDGNCADACWLKDKAGRAWIDSYECQGGYPSTNTLKGWLYNNGPVDVAITIKRDFLYYKSGVYAPVIDENIKANHDVVLVGWDDSQGAFFFKNSWGPSWGDNGYGALAYGGVERACNINFSPPCLDPDNCYQGGTWERSDSYDHVDWYWETPWHDHDMALRFSHSSSCYDIQGSGDDKYLRIRCVGAYAAIDWDLYGLEDFAGAWCTALLHGTTISGQNKTWVRFIVYYNGNNYYSSCFQPPADQWTYYNLVDYGGYLSDNCWGGDCWCGIQLCDDAESVVWMKSLEVREIDAALEVALPHLWVTSKGDHISIGWSTSWEDNNAGWNLYRSADGGEYVKLNDALIEPYQYDYEYIDADVEAGVKYCYKLEAVDLDGSVQTFGPECLVFGPPDSHGDSADVPDVSADDDALSAAGGCGW